MERFQVVDSNNVKLPGSCVICGYGEDGRPFIDFGVQVKKYGRLYFCVSCFRECERVVNGPVDNPNAFRPSNVRADVPNDVPQSEPTKRSPGRPKGSNTRTTQPTTK